MHIMSNLRIATKLCNFLKIMGRDVIFILVTCRKIVIWLGFRSPVFLDITLQQNQMTKYQSIETKERIFQTETLISNIH